jgi:ATP-dependent Lon protease
MSLPWLPLFPLGVVLFPRTALPLHIFEERYKKMINLALEGTREFGVVLAMEKGLAQTGCTARIEKLVKTFDDGRMDIVTTGYRRFEIEELNEDEPYLRARITYFDDEDAEKPSEEMIHRAIRGYYAMRALSDNEDSPEADLNDPQLSFQLAQTVKELTMRQVLLMTRSEKERIEKLADYLPQTAARQRKIEAFRSIVPRNGHGRLLPGS